MTPKTYSCFILVLVAALGGITRGESLEATFKNPQNSARPHTWFHWMNGHVTKSGITKDLEAMQAAGIGGYQLFDIGWGTPKGPYPYASEGWLDRVGHCAAESTRTGVQMGFHNCSGWSSSGGPWVSAEKSMKWVVWREAQVTRDSETVLLEEPHPIKGVHDAKLNIYNAHKDKRFYEDIVVLAFPTPTDPFRIENWERKALSNGGDSRTQHFAPDTRIATPASVVPFGKIIDITQHLKTDGTLDWRPKSSTWTVIRFGYSSNGITNRPGSFGGTGLEIDKLDPTAVDLHWQAFLDKVVNVVQGKGKIHEMLVDSYEVGVQNWTAGFAGMFEERNGYDLTPYLVCLAGYTVNDVVTTERVLWDLRTTVKELMHQNYFGRFKEKCRENGITFVTEPYGKGPFDAVDVARMSEIPMGEFWYPDDGFGRKLWKPWSAKVAASGAHLSGRRIVGAEAFTSWHGDFKQVPSDLKPVMDKYYTLGINRNVFHTYAHQPWHESVKPGMTMHRFGKNFHRNNTWFLEGREFFDYMARCQTIFQSGTYMADVLILYGDERGFYNLGGSDIETVFLPGHNWDLGNMNVLRDLSVEKGGEIRVSFEERLLESRYQVLVVKHGDLMQIDSIKRLGALAEKGAKILAPRPQRSPSLRDATTADAQFEALVKTYWDSGLILDSDTFDEVMASTIDDCAGPNNIQFCRTRIGEDDYFFVVNSDDEPNDFALTFRVSGKQPEIWNPMTGSTRTAKHWQQREDGRTTVNLSLPAHGSCFVVFRQATNKKGEEAGKEVLEPFHTLTGPWTVRFDPTWGPNTPVVFDTLLPWNEHTQEDIKYFSGTATYQTTFQLDTVPCTKMILDLGLVGDMARVRINETAIPLLWQAPFVFDVSAAIKQGKNTLEIDVTNSWHNRLVGDSRLAKHKPLLPGWLKAGNPIPADSERKTWAFYNHQKPSHPLTTAGLLGPVRLSVLIGTAYAWADSRPKIAVMETAFGNRGVVESVAMAKEAGYAGVQIHTGSLGKDGVLTLARPDVIRAFQEARTEHKIEIVSLCAGEMNKYNAWEKESRKKALSIAKQSIKACQALDVPILLVPFFGKAQFGNDPNDPKFKAAISLFRELLPIAQTNNVVLALESPTKKPALDHLLKAINHPQLKIYYDTGNMQGQGEDIYRVIETWGPNIICQIHLKPFQSPTGIFAQGATDVSRLARTIKKSGYHAWFVFEAGRGKQQRGVPFAKQNRQGIEKLCKELQSSMP